MNAIAKRASRTGARLTASSEGVVYFLVAAGVLVFVLWPVAAVFLKSVVIEGRLDFSQYVYLWQEERQLLANTLFVSSTVTVLSVGLGLCIALYLSHTRMRAKPLVFGTLMCSIISPPFVSSLVYIMLFGRRGLITHKLLGLSVSPYGWHGVVLMQTAGYVALAAFLILGVLHRVEPRLEDASLDLGATPLRALTTVTLPLAAPGLMVAAVIVFIRSLSDFGTPIIIGGRFTVLATEAYLNVIGIYNMPRAAAMGMVLLLPALAAFLLYRRVIGSSGFHAARPTLDPGAQRMELPLGPKLFLALVTWAWVSFELVKYGTILCGAFTRTWGVNFTPTLMHFRSLSANNLGAFVRSLEYALAAAVVGSLLGLVLSYFLERKGPPGAGILNFIADLPYIIPGPFFGIAYILAFHNPPLVLTGTAFIILANCVFRQLPVSVNAGVAVLKQCNPELEAGCRDLGAREWRVLVDIVAPLMKPAFLISFINTFTMTMITIGAIIFLVSPGTRLATIVMFADIKRGNIGGASVMANLIIVSVLAVNLGFSWFFLRKPETRRRGDVPASVRAAKEL